MTAESTENDDTLPSPHLHDRKYTIIKGRDRFNLVNDLASGDFTHVFLAERYGKTREAISQFAIRNRAEIEEAKAKYYDEYQHIWSAKKSARIDGLERMKERLELDFTDPKLAWSARARISSAIAKLDHQIAEELGDLPTRTTVEVAGSSKLTHEVVGWSPDQWVGKLNSGDPE